MATLRIVSIEPIDEGVLGPGGRLCTSTIEGTMGDSVGDVGLGAAPNELEIASMLPSVTDGRGL